IVEIGTSKTFTVSTNDVDSDPVSVRWLLDFVQVGTGTSFSYTPLAAALGVRTLRAEASDGQGGFATYDFLADVLYPDVDHDGWRSNLDCDDNNPARHPGQPEILFNGIDDDCNAATLDGGTPPVASFTIGSVVGTPLQAVQFTDTSIDIDSPIVSWAW